MCVCIHNPKQHIPDNKDVITCVAWSNNDDVIASCNAEGAVYAWDLRNLKRIEDYVDKSCKKLHHLILDWGPQWEFKRNLGNRLIEHAYMNVCMCTFLILLLFSLLFMCIFDLTAHLSF